MNTTLCKPGVGLIDGTMNPLPPCYYRGLPNGGSASLGHDAKRPFLPLSSPDPEQPKLVFPKPAGNTQNSATTSHFTPLLYLRQSTFPQKSPRNGTRNPRGGLAITRQKARYARYADTKQWSKFEALALPNAPYSFCDSDGQPLVFGPHTLVFDTASSIASFFQRFFADQDTMHNIGPGDFEQVKPDEVNSVFGFEDQINSKALGNWASIRGGGYYYETWKLVDGEWYIKSLRMERRYQEMTWPVKLRIAIAGLFGTALV